MGKPIIRFKGYEDDWEQRKLGKTQNSNQHHVFIRINGLIQVLHSINHGADRKVLYE